VIQAMPDVVLIRCASYDAQAVEEALRRGIGLLGGAERFAGKAERILLKPSLLAADPPERGTATHPAVFRAACRIFKETGARVSYGDSPAQGSPLAAARRAGLHEVAVTEGVPLADFVTPVEVRHAVGRQNRRFVIARAVAEADGLISLPKLKTHGLMRVTGCVKNQFGCVPGFLKAEFHARLPDASSFARMLVDLNSLVAPRLYILDGVYGMEGNGPRNGSCRKMNILLLSDDPVALDATLCRLIDLDPQLVPTIVHGEELGCWTAREDRIRLLGDSFPLPSWPDFAANRDPLRQGSRGGSPLAKALIAVTGTKPGRRLTERLFLAKPSLDASLCTRCGTCIQICPLDPKAIAWPEGDTRRAPRHDRRRCIRCFCCQETCPTGAISIKHTPLRNLLVGR
jgi:uncharacterized protein (DUF362 family)/ferredoxin